MQTIKLSIITALLATGAWAQNPMARNSDPISLGTNYLSTTQTAATAGTTAGLLVVMDSSGNMATAATSAVGALGIAVTTQTTGQSVQVATRGIINCVADNSTTIGNLLGVGTTTAGRCKDLGVTDSTTVVSNIQIIGRARTAVSAAANVSVQLFGPGHYGTSSFLGTGTATLGTSAISANACASLVTVSATGTASTDAITWTPNADISGVTGYGITSTDGLIIYPYPTTNNVNFKVCNGTGTSITPGAVTLNWRVSR